MDENSLAHLEKLGYEGVLLELAKGNGRLGRPGSELREDIEHWLRLKESAIRDAREEATLSVAKEANIIALSASSLAAAANKIARSAKAESRLSLWIASAISAAVAVITTIITVKCG